MIILKLYINFSTLKYIFPSSSFPNPYYVEYNHYNPAAYSRYINYPWPGTNKKKKVNKKMVVTRNIVYVSVVLSVFLESKLQFFFLNILFLLSSYLSML